MFDRVVPVTEKIWKAVPVPAMGSTTRGGFSSSMKLSQLTCFGWCANMMLDRREQAPFTIDEIYDASGRGDLVGLLLKIDDSGIIELWARDSAARAEMERALRNAASALNGREPRKAGIGENALCLVIALTLEAIQQNFSRQ